MLAAAILMLNVPEAALAVPKLTEEQIHLAEKYGTLYIAGSRKDLPLEGIYDGDFAGVMPQFYQRLSELTGMHFVYLDSRTDRKELAATMQCDILSLVTEDDVLLQKEGLIPGPVCFTYDGAEYRIAYTRRMPAELIEIIDAAFAKMSDGDRLQCAIAGAAQSYFAGMSRGYRVVLYIMIGLCATLLAFLLFLVVRDRRRMKKAHTIDAVTGLYNHEGFSKRYDRLKEQRRFPLYFLAYVLIDCDKELVFSGEEAMNLRMKAGADALREHLQSDWIAARTGASSFLLCFSVGPQRQAVDVLKPILNAMEDRMNRDQGVSYCRTYAGICRSDDTQGDLDKAINEIRIAAWKAKEQEKRILTGSIALAQSAASDYLLGKELLATMNMADFQVYILPMVKPADTKVTGGRAIVRWQHPSRGLLLPNDFLPYIVKTDRIKELDLWVFDRICAWSRRRREEGLSSLLVTCKISWISINDSGIYSAMLEKMLQYGIRSGEIGIEVDSGIVRHETKAILENIEGLHRAGVMVILDRFGSDKTSHSALVKYTVDMMKLHSGLLPKETSNGRGLRQRLYLLDNTISLCKRLGIRIICSGVENKDHHTIAQELGCDLAEGNYYYQPMPCSEFDRNFQ